jgi:hypothetical protein
VTPDALRWLTGAPRRQVGRAYGLIRAAAFSLTILPSVVTCAFRDAPATLRAHSLVFQRMEGGLGEISTPALSAGTGANVTLVSVGRGDIAAFQPPAADTGDLSFRQLGATHNYTNWPSSGTALYAATDPIGSKDRAIRVTTPPNDEVTLAVVTVGGRRVQDVAWSEVLAPAALTSPKVTTTGPATLIAFWWGDAGVRNDKRAVPNGGFEVVDAVLESGALVQCAVAVKHVTEAGSYDVTWRARPVQGAQLWIVAVE